MLTAICDCFGTPAHVVTTSGSPNRLRGQYDYTSEKMTYYQDEPIKCTEPEVAAKVIATLYDAKARGSGLEKAVEEIVKQTGWWDKAIAKAVFTALEKTLEAGKSMGPALRHAYDEAVKEAEKIEEFAREHPVLTGVVCAIIALGVLYLLWPAVVEAMGFGELGPIEGTMKSNCRFFI